MSYPQSASYYFTANKMDLFLRELTKQHPQTPTWDDLLVYLRDRMRANPTQPVVHMSFSGLNSALPLTPEHHTHAAAQEEPFLTLERQKSTGALEALKLRADITHTMPKKHLPALKRLKEAQRTDFLIQSYRLQAPDVEFTVDRLAKIVQDKNVKQIQPLDIYRITPTILPRLREESMLRFMRAQSPAAETGFYNDLDSQHPQAFLRYYLLNLK